MLYIAIPKGRLRDGVLRLLERAGYPITFPHERALISDPVKGVRAQLVKPRSIPQLVHQGSMGAGFAGLDLLTEADYPDLDPIVDLGDRPVEIVVAAAARHVDLLNSPPKRPLFIATEYPTIASRWAMGKGLSHVPHQTHGSTEGYADRIADIIVDCVETGATLAGNGLIPLETVLRSTTHLVVRRVPENGTLSSELTTFVQAIRAQERLS